MFVAGQQHQLHGADARHAHRRARPGWNPGQPPTTCWKPTTRRRRSSIRTRPTRRIRRTRCSCASTRWRGTRRDRWRPAGSSTAAAWSTAWQSATSATGREVKAQAATTLGIRLVDTDIFNVPLLLTDPYGHFIRGANGFPQFVTSLTPLATSPAAPTRTDRVRPFPRTHQDQPRVPRRHRAQRGSDGADGRGADAGSGHRCQRHLRSPGLRAPTTTSCSTRHFVTGDGRGNENIALTAVHTVFHLEHNRLRERHRRPDSDAGLPDARPK